MSSVCSTTMSPPLPLTPVPPPHNDSVNQSNLIVPLKPVHFSVVNGHTVKDIEPVEYIEAMYEGLHCNEGLRTNTDDLQVCRDQASDEELDEDEDNETDETKKLKQTLERIKASAMIKTKKLFKRI